MGTPFVAPLGFASVDSAGTISAISGTEDNAVQFYKLATDINGVVTIPANTKHKKIIFDINGKTISGGGSTPILYNNDSTPLVLKGNGLITSSGSLAFSGNGTGDATVDSATQGLGSTGQVVIDVQDNDIPFPARDDFEDLIQVQNGTFHNPKNAYAYYPEYYYTANPPGTIPPAASSSAPVTLQYNNSTWQAYQNTLMQDISGSSNVMQSSAGGQPGDQFGALFSIGAGRFELRVPHNGAVAILKHDGTNSTFESGTGTITGSQTGYATKSQSGGTPFFGVSFRTYTWVITVGGVALNITALWQADVYKPGQVPYYAGGLYFGTNATATAPLPSGTTMRLPATGIFTQGKRAVVQNANDNPISFSLAGGTDSSVPANDSATVVNSASTAESWSFSGVKPTTTSVDETSGIAVAITSVNIDTTNQTIALDWVDNFLGFSDGNSDRRNGGWLPKIPAGMSFVMADGTVYGPGTYIFDNSQLLSGFLSPVMTSAHVTETLGTNGSKLSLSGIAPHNVFGGTFSNLTTTTYSNGGPGQFYEFGIPGNTSGYTTSLRYHSSGAVIFRDHVSITAGNGSGQITSGTTSGITKRIVGTKFTNNTGVLLSNFTSGGITPTTIASGANVIVESDGLTTFSATQPAVNSNNDPLAPFPPISGNGVVINDSGQPIEGVDLTGFTGELNATRSGSNSTTIYQVTVANSGGGNKFYIDGVEAPTLTFVEGNTYIFIQSDITNRHPLVHPLRFSTTSNGSHGGGTEYTTGVTINGTTGYLGSYTKITVAIGAPTLYYYCTNHSGMGGQINT